MAKQEIYLAVYMVLQQDNKTLFLQRANTGYMDGYYSIPAGHVDSPSIRQHELATEAALRESGEEIGITVKIKESDFVHCCHRLTNDYHHQYIDLYFRVDQWQGQIINKEPDKCKTLLWADDRQVDKLIVPEVRQALRCIENNQPYSQFVPS